MKRFFYPLLAGLLLSACKADHTAENQKHQVYHRIAIVGNSMTIHGPEPSVGWNRNWGMAASAPEFDYVHVLSARFKQADPAAQVKIKSIARWEKDFWEYDLHQLDSLENFRPDLVIVRIGENVHADSIESGNFRAHFATLLNKLSGSGPARVTVFGSFWKCPQADAAMQQVCEEKHVQYVPLGELSDDPKNEAIGLYPNPGVAAHPSDAGMLAMANSIWNNL